MFSYAGRVAKLADQPVPTRVGGFGGVDGLAQFITQNAISHVIDATHPFAERMSRNAVQACAQVDVPLIALTRARWSAQPGDTWRFVATINEAAAALDTPAQNVFLAIGRQNLAAFAGQSQHHYLLRLVDEPDAPLPLPDCRVVVARGPFTQDGDLALMQKHGIDVVVSKNAGGEAARAKLDAARALNLPVIMIERPSLPKRRETHSVETVMRWFHNDTDLGV